MFFMKLRISIVALGLSLLVNAGCSSVKTAYNGEEQSHFTNPAKLASTANTQGLPPVAEAPADATPLVPAANPGGTGGGSMAGTTMPDSWGGSLETR